MTAVSLSRFPRINQLLPRLLGTREGWCIAGLQLFLQRYYYCIAETPDYAVGSHAHDWFELSQLVCGKVEYSDSARKHAMGPGEVFFMAPGSVHQWRVVQAPVVISSFQLRISPFNEEGRQLAEELGALSSRHVFRLPKIAELVRISDAWYAELASRSPGVLAAEKLHARFHLYFASFFECALRGALSARAPMPAEESLGASRSSSSHITDYIQQNIHQPIRLEDISSHFQYSARHINRIFQREHNVSVGQYILERKLQAAQQLLVTTACSVKHAAHSVGYLDAGYFCRLFRHQFGSTPTEYRHRLNPTVTPER